MPTDRGIIFSPAMVRALLADQKTMTRRLASSQHAKAEPGDRFYVREAWGCHWDTDDQKASQIDPDLWAVRYFADDHISPARRDGSIILPEQCRKKRPSIFMPRWASRLTLIVEAKRFEPVDQISGADAVAEGVRARLPDNGIAQDEFRDLWNSLHTKDGERFDDGPLVVALTFRVVRANIDRLDSAT